MDLPGAKDYAKGKWRAGHGGGHHHGKGKPSSKGASAAVIVDTSSSQRQSGDDGRQSAEQDEWGMEASAQDDHEVPPQSQGADLAELLEQAQLQYEQSFYRFRGIQEELLLQSAPPSDQASKEALTVDLNALAASLASLPLHTLLGVPKIYTQDLPVEQLQDLYPAPQASTHPQTPVPAEQPVKLQAATAEPVQPVQQALQAANMPHSQQQQQQHHHHHQAGSIAKLLQGPAPGTVARPGTTQQPHAPQSQYAPATQPARQQLSQPPPQSAQPVTPMPADDDDFLDTLLQDIKPQMLGRSPVAGWSAPTTASMAASTVHSSSRALGPARPAASSSSSTQAQGANRADAYNMAQPHPAETKPAAEAIDDLDELLKLSAPAVPLSGAGKASKLSPQVVRQAGQTNPPPVKAPAQSLEDWLGI